MHYAARDRALAPAAGPPSSPSTPDARAHSLAGTLRMTGLHPPMQRGDAAVAGRLVEHRVTLGGGGKRLRVAVFLHLERIEASAQHENELVAQHLTGGAQFAVKA